MNFKSAERISEVIECMRKADETRAANRTRINDLFNGFPPYSEAEEVELKVQTNVNFLEGPKIAHEARRTFANAFLSQSRYFTASCVEGPTDKKDDWSTFVTNRVNRALKQTREYFELQRNVQGQLVLHGIGPCQWQDRYSPIPRFIGIEDLLVPSGTYVDLTNLNHFAIYRRYTPAELYEKTHGKHVDPAWNVKLIDKLLLSLSDSNNQQEVLDYDRWPEKVHEDYKANSGFYNSDRVPTINCWDFYFRREWTDSELWERRITLDTYESTSSQADEARSAKLSSALKDTKGQFLFHPEGRTYAKSLSHLLHVNFADGNNVAPFRYHSVRSLGWLLYAVCQLQNRMRCKFTDSAFEATLWYFRNVPAEDREKLENIQLQNMGVIPQGVEFVPANERYTVNEELIGAWLAQNRQLMSENSASFVQDVDNGTQKELTATEVMQRAQSAAALTNGMLLQSYMYERYKYREILRRFFISGSTHPMVRKFHDDCRSHGISEEYLDIEKWEVEPDKVIGGGNKVLEIAQTDRLMAVRTQFDPQAQRIILNRFALANTDDPDLASRLVPMEQKEASHTLQLATLAIGTLLQGIPVVVGRDINVVEYVGALLKLVGMKIQQLNSDGGMASKETIVGLSTAVAHIQEFIKQLAEDKEQQQIVKVFEDQLGQLVNFIKAFAQRLQQQQKSAGAGVPPEVQSKLMLAATSAKIKEAGAQQKERHRELQFQQQQRRENLKTLSDVAAKDLQTAAEVRRGNLKSLHE